jgi:hypothetical protein
MKTTYQFLIACALVFYITGCTKFEKNFDLEESQAKQARLTAQVKQRLADAPHGWVIYVPNLDTAILTATPVVVKFDTLRNSFTTQSPFPLSNTGSTSLFEVSSATGVPLLSFATGSLFSSWYEAGDINDYYFKILDAGQDTINIQPYRKGKIYASEGGIPMKMIRLKAPATFFDNPVDLKELFSGNGAPFLNSADNRLTLTYKNGYVVPAPNLEFGSFGPGDVGFFQAYVPFSRDLKMYPLALFVNGDYENYGVAYLGINAMNFHVDNGFSPASLFVDAPKKMLRMLKTDYLLVRSVNAERTKVSLYAVDRNGTEVITGTLEVQ